MSRLRVSWLNLPAAVLVASAVMLPAQEAPTLANDLDISITRTEPRWGPKPVRSPKSRVVNRIPNTFPFLRTTSF